MRFTRAIFCLAFFATVLVARPAKAAPARQAAAEGDCGSIKAAMGEAKFSGQISTTPVAGTFEVTAGKESAAVTYSGPVLICQGGQPASSSALVAGASVVVYGPVKQEGNVFRMDATKIVVAAPGQESQRASAPKDAISAVESVIRPSGQQKGQSASGGISCASIEFGVSAKDTGTGHTSGRASVTSITCRIPLGPVAMELTEDVLNGKRMGDVTLNSQNQLVATLTNAGIDSVVFTAEGGEQVVDVTFDYERAEIQHSVSGMRVTF